MQQAAQMQQTASTMKDMGQAADSEGLQAIMQQLQNGEPVL